jgi:hypothetical protein
MLVSPDGADQHVLRVKQHNLESAAVLESPGGEPSAVGVISNQPALLVNKRSYNALAALMRSIAPPLKGGIRCERQLRCWH